MKTIKKTAAFLLAAFLLAGVAGCAGQTSTGQSTTAAASKPAPVTVRVAALNGPTGLGLAKLMDNSAKSLTQGQYAVSLEASPTFIVPLITTGDADIAAVPLNTAAVLYNRTGGAVKMLAINTLGVLYLLEQGDTIKTIADLKGKTVYSSGQGASPEYILNYLLKENGLDPEKDVTVEYKEDHSKLAADAASGEAAVCLLPEPFVTTAMSKNTKLRIALDMTEEWEKADKAKGSESTLAMGCLVVRAEFAEKNAAAVHTFLSEYEASVKFINANLPQAGILAAKFGIVPDAALAQKAIPNCNITFIAGSDMKRIAAQNFAVLFEANPSSVGGALPKDDFYYGA